MRPTHCYNLSSRFGEGCDVVITHKSVCDYTIESLGLYSSTSYQGHAIVIK